MLDIKQVRSIREGKKICHSPGMGAASVITEPFINWRKFSKSTIQKMKTHTHTRRQEDSRSPSSCFFLSFCFGLSPHIQMGV